MNFSLLSQNLILVFTAILASLIFYIIGNTTKMWKQNYLKWTIIFGITLSMLIEITVITTFPGNKFPELAIMLLPVGLCVSLIVFKPSHSFKYKYFSYLALVVSIIYSALLINNYYQYYPNLYSALSINHFYSIFPDKNSRITDYSNAKFVNIDTLERNNSFDTSNGIFVGKVYGVNIPGKVSGFKSRPSWIYFPPVAFSPHKILLPVIVLLSGMPGQTSDWLDGGGLIGIMNQFANAHHGIAPVVVMPDNSGSLTNDTECVNSPRGNIETYLTQDVPSYIKSQFNVSTSPRNWSIGGLSAGGMCGIMLTLRHPNTYHYFLDFGGESAPEIGNNAMTISGLFSGNIASWREHQPSYLLANNKYNNIGGVFMTGVDDNPVVIGAESQLYKTSSQNKLDVAYKLIPGSHTFDVWQRSFQLSLPWISNRIGATNCNNSCNF